MNILRFLLATVIPLLFFIAAARYGARPHMPTDAELYKIADERVAVCKDRTDDLAIDVAKSGSSIAMKSGNKMFLTLPRDLYPEQNLQLDGSDVTMAVVQNGETLDHKNEPCWTHYYEFKTVKGIAEGRTTLTILSSDLNLPDYVLHLIVSTVDNNR